MFLLRILPKYAGGAKIDKCENIGGDAYIYSSEDVLFISYNFSKRGLTFLKHEKMKYV